ncbi:MAG: hypothetical protein ABI353_15365 [Isosphaeraceae bacterium]
MPVVWCGVVLAAGLGDAAAPTLETQPKLVSLAPGLRVGTDAPRGWTDLVVKSVPRLASGDLASLPRAAKGTAALFRTVVLADVGRAADPKLGYVLRRVGVGMALPVRGRDTVVTSATLETLDVSLSSLSRLVLHRAEAELAKGRLIASTPRFALYSTPAELVVGGIHRAVWLRYALWVDPSTGSLHAGVWAIANDPSKPIPVRTWVKLCPPLVFDCPLDVDASRILGAIPISWSFAMTALPPGRTRSMPSPLQPLAARDPKTPDEVEALERGLRAVE